MSELTRGGETALIPDDDWNEALLESSAFHIERQTRDDVMASFHNKKTKVIVDIDNNVFMPGPNAEVMCIPCMRKPGSVRLADIPEWYMATKMWWVKWGEGYRFNPFMRDITQQFALGRGKPEVVVTNIGPEIAEPEQQSILDAYSWFDRQTNGAVFQKAAGVVIGHHIAFQYDSAAPTLAFGKPMGLYDPVKQLISVSSVVTNEVTPPQHIVRRYKALLDNGVNLTDIIMTHELAHAMFFDFQYAEIFRQKVGWEERVLDIGKGRKASWHIIEGLIGDNLPPTDYGQYASVEDIAESTVYYRYAPELLDQVRVEALGKMFAMLAEGGEGVVEDVKMAALNQPVYPHHKLPEHLVVRFRPLRPSLVERVGKQMLSKMAKDMQIILGTSKKQRYNSVQ